MSRKAKRAAGGAGAPALRPELAEAIRRHQAGDLAAAERGYRAALKAAPNDANANHFLAILYYQAGRAEEAVGHFRRALATAPGAFQTWHDLGIALQSLGRDDEAVAAYEKVLALRPGHAETLGHFARLHEERNRLDEARAAVARGLAAAHDDPVINLIAARLERRDGNPEIARARLASFANAGAPEPVREKIEYELGRLCDLTGAYEAALDHFAEANRLAARKASARLADKNRYLALIEALRARFTPEWIATWTPAPPLAGRATPVFQVGFPRSGTTLLDQILNSHPGIRTVEERPAVDALVRAVAALPGGFPDALATLTPDQFAAVRSEYFAVLDRTAPPGEGIVVDKLPLNLVQAGPILRIFPEARFVLSLRHPCDVCLSCFMQDFAMSTAMANFFTLEDAANLYDKAMSLWLHYEAVLPMRVQRVRYEDLTSNLEGAVRPLLDFLGLEWDERMREFTKTASSRERIATPSYHQVAQPIYQRARYRWARYGKRLDPVAQRLAPYIARFGYGEKYDSEGRV